MKLPQEYRRGSVQWQIFLVYSTTVYFSLVRQDQRSLPDLGRVLYSLLEELACASCGPMILEATSWGLSDGSQQLRRCGQLLGNLGRYSHAEDLGRALVHTIRT